MGNEVIIKAAANASTVFVNNGVFRGVVDLGKLDVQKLNQAP